MTDKGSGFPAEGTTDSGSPATKALFPALVGGIVATIGICAALAATGAIPVWMAIGLAVLIAVFDTAVIGFVIKAQAASRAGSYVASKAGADTEEGAARVDSHGHPDREPVDYDAPFLD